MATELIKSERAISLLKKGAKRLNDGGGLYLLPFAGGDTHYWRLDYAFQGRRKTLSLGSHPQVTLEMARERAQEARAVLAAGLDPSRERRQTREAHVQAAQARRRALSGQPQEGSFECVARRWFAVKESQWMENYSSKVIRRLELHAFPKFGPKPLHEISPKIVLDTATVSG